MKTRQSEKEVYKTIDKKKSFCFDAGPGSGKTYTLVKSIEHILSTNNKISSRNQKLLCITYTNAAKNEIIKRIGKNSNVIVSTIHEFLWNFISTQDFLLRKEHQCDVESHKEAIHKKLQENVLYEKIKDQDSFDSIIRNKKFQKIFYGNQQKRVSEFREALSDYSQLNPYLKNVAKFKELVKLIIKERRLNQVSEEIRTGKGKAIMYDPMHNYDRLHKYIISHDTLLKYAKNIISNNNILKRLFIDKYPYVLIDEYQDTDKTVISLLKSILEYSSKKQNFVIGFFGDSKQNIYENGIGELTELDSLKYIEEKENRRSCSEIVEVINRIRNDNLKQISFERDGKCTFYKVDSSFNIEEYKNKFDFEGDTACLLLENKEIATAKSFGDLYLNLSEFPQFSGINFANINSEFFQKNLQNMGWFLRNIFNLIDFKRRLDDSNTTIKSIEKYIGVERGLTFGDLINFLSKIKQINTKEITLINYIEALEKIEGTIKGANIISHIFSIDSGIGEIYMQADSYFYNGDNDDTSKSIDAFFNLKLSQFENWHDYINKIEDKKLNYYTLHGAKGLEFENVVVVIQDAFAHRKDYFRLFFENYNEYGNLDEKKRKKYEKARNLLYVACSRAKKNLYIFYKTNDELGSSQENIERIFGKIETFD